MIVAALAAALVVAEVAPATEPSRDLAPVPPSEGVERVPPSQVPAPVAPSRDVALVLTALGGTGAGGLEVGLLYRTERVAIGALAGLVVMGSDAGGELGATFGVQHVLASGTRLELLLDGGAITFSRDDTDGDDDLFALLGSKEVSGSTATLPFAQVRAGMEWRLSAGRLLTLGGYARTVPRKDVTYTERDCVLFDLYCGEGAGNAQYGGTSVGVYLGLCVARPVR